MKHLPYISCFLLLLACFAACKKENYKNDGGVHDPNVNMTTYDYLKSKHVFDSLVYLIDKAGMKDAINGDVTFFATTNYGIESYLKTRTARLVRQTGDENVKFTMDSFTVKELRDSIQLYMIKGKINRPQMTLDGQLYDCTLGPIPNVKFLIKLVRKYDYSAYLNYVDYVNYGKVIGSRDDLDPNPDQIPPAERDINYLCQTSGIVTTTGILHVMDGRARFMFNNE